MEFVDSNILVYAYDESERDRQTAAVALVEGLGTSRGGVVSIQVLQEFYVNVVGKIPKRFTPSEARERLRLLARWPVHSPVAADVLAATALAEENRISFWDAMIVRSASEMRCDVLWSEDLNDGQTISGVRIQNPFRV